MYESIIVPIKNPLTHSTLVCFRSLQRRMKFWTRPSDSKGVLKLQRRKNFLSISKGGTGWGSESFLSPERRVFTFFHDSEKNFEIEENKLEEADKFLLSRSRQKYPVYQGLRDISQNVKHQIRR